MASKLAHFFLDIDMRCNHDGLKSMLDRLKIKVGPNDYVVFMNKSRTMVKMFCHGQEALMHYKKDGRKLDPGVIAYLPEFCDGQAIDMDGAVGKHLKDMIKRRKKKVQ